MRINILRKEIEDIITYPPNDFLDPDIYGDVGQKVMEIERTNRYQDALKLYYFLRKVTEVGEKSGEAKEVVKRYQILIVWLQFLALKFMGDDQLKDLFTHHLVEGIRLGIDIRERIRMLYKVTWDPFILGEHQGTLLKALQQNTEQFRRNTTPQTGLEHPAPTTLSALIADYNVFTKSEERRGNIDEMNYMNHAQYLRNLTPGERELTLKILQIYDFVRYPPLDELAREMAVSPLVETPTAGLTAKVSPTIVSPVSSAVSSTVSKPRSRNTEELLAFALKQLQKPFVEEKSLRSKISDDAVQAKKELVVSLQSNNGNRVIGTLLLLARIKRLHDALKDSSSWRETVGAYVSKKYTADLGTFIEANPTHPAVISEFLQYLLGERLGYDAEESAVVAMELGDIMGGAYKLMAYADEVQGKYMWTPHEVKEGKLVERL